jgi:biotin carboxylase
LCSPISEQKAGVPTVPGSKGLISNEKEALEVARQIGIPVMIKATAGACLRAQQLNDLNHVNKGISARSC